MHQRIDTNSVRILTIVGNEEDNVITTQGGSNANNIYILGGGDRIFFSLNPNNRLSQKS